MVPAVMPPGDAALARTFEMLIERMHDAETGLRRQEERLALRMDLQDQRMRPGVADRYDTNFFVEDSDPTTYMRRWVVPNPLMEMPGDSSPVARRAKTLVTVYAPQTLGSACGLNVLVVANLVPRAGGEAAPDTGPLFERFGEMAAAAGLSARATFARERAYFLVAKHYGMLDPGEGATTWWDRALGLVLAAADAVGMDTLGLFTPGGQRPNFPAEFDIVVNPGDTPAWCVNTPVFVESRFLSSMKRYAR